LVLSDVSELTFEGVSDAGM
jgi:hypothetical protein